MYMHAYIAAAGWFLCRTSKQKKCVCRENRKYLKRQKELCVTSSVPAQHSLG